MHFIQQQDMTNSLDDKADGNIDIRDFIEDYYPQDYRKPLYHLPMLRGCFNDEYSA